MRGSVHHGSPRSPFLFDLVTEMTTSKALFPWESIGTGTCSSSNVSDSEYLNEAALPSEEVGTVKVFSAAWKTLQIGLRWVLHLPGAKCCFRLT